MQAIPQPSGWPDFGLGCGHPKSRKFLPVSASARNAMSVSTGAGLWLTIASIRHMSTQLVPHLSEPRDPLRPVSPGLEAFGPLSGDDPEAAAAPLRGRDDDVEGIRGRGVARHDFGHVPQGPQDVDRVGVFQEADRKLSRPDGKRVFRGERLQAIIVPLDADETRPGRLAERDAELDPGYGPDERFVDVLRGLDEVRLTEDHIQPVRVLDGDEFRFHGHRQCIGPRELKSSSRRSGGTLRARARERASASIGGAWRESKGCGRSSAMSATRRSAKTSRSWRRRFKCTSPVASLGNGPSWNSWRSGSGGRPRARVDVLERSWSSGCSACPGTSRTTGPRSSRSSTAPMCPPPSPSSSPHDLSGAGRGLRHPLQEPGRPQRLVAKHEEVRRHEGEEFVRHVAHGSVADRSDRAIGVELERATHPPTHGGQPVYRAVRSFDEVPMESRVRGFRERIADDLWCLNDPRERIISKGEPEAESRDRMASNAREPVADELAVCDVLPPKVFHRPPQRPAYSFERRSDFGAAVSVHLSSGNRCDP